MATRCELKHSLPFFGLCIRVSRYVEVVQMHNIANNKNWDEGQLHFLSTTLQFSLLVNDHVIENQKP